MDLALFAERVPSLTKKLMVEALTYYEGREKPPKCSQINLKAFQDQGKMLEQFVTSNLMVLFKRLSLSSGYLSRDPDTWEGNAEYQKPRAVVTGLSVINDHAERAVALV